MRDAILVLYYDHVAISGKYRLTERGDPVHEGLTADPRFAAREWMSKLFACRAATTVDRWERDATMPSAR